MYQKGNRMVWIPAVFGLMVLIFVSTAFVSASPQLPCEFYGTVTISGSPAPVGTIITAYVNSVKQGSIIVKEPGKYGGTGTFDERLIVLAGENDFTGGTPGITFKIGDKVADQTAPYAPGQSTELSMTTGGGGATAPATAPPSPAVNNTSSTMQVSSVPAAPVITAAPVPVQTPVPAPVISMAATPVSQSPPAALNVTTQVSGNQSTGNQSVQKNVPVVIPPVVPVVTAVLQPVVPPVPVNQTVTNATNASNATAVPVNVTSTVSFPSGQTITK